MRYIVRGIEAHEYTAVLKNQMRLVDDPESKEEAWIDADGNVEIRKSFRTVLVREHLTPLSLEERIYVGYPGERCITIEGSPQFVKGVLEILSIPTDNFAKRFCSERTWGSFPPGAHMHINNFLG